MSQELLASLFNKYNCDKASKHKYHEVYGPDLEKYRTQKTFKMIEVGILRGESISAWLEYFPDCKKIVGIDTFDRVPEENISILSDPRVESIKGDSMTTDFSEYLGRQKFDVIIDDGLHAPKANGATFKNLVKFLKKTGVYYIEDVWPIDIMSEKEMQHRWVQKHKGRYSRERFELFLQDLESFNVERIDLRKKSGNPDSYIFKITHQ